MNFLQIFNLCIPILKLVDKLLYISDIILFMKHFPCISKKNKYFYIPLITCIVHFFNIIFLVSGID